MSISWRRLGVGLGLIGISSAISLSCGKLGNWEKTTTEETAALQSRETSSVIPALMKSAETSSTAGEGNFVVQVVQKVGSAVVRIDAVTSAERDPSNDLDNPLYKRFFSEKPPLTKPRERLERGTGSGVIISSQGEIITNAHVVKGSSGVKVTLKSGQVYAGKILGLDQITDIAVIKIEANNLPTVTLGDIKTLNPGDWAIAIGNPLGLDNTVTLGIISALGRSSSQVGIPNERVKFIQTDAAINPGNSGGPLFNTQGEVIGINTAIRSDAQGLGFAIPIDTAQKIAMQIITKGSAEHAYIGIHMVTLSQEIKEQLKKEDPSYSNLQKDQGVLIMRVLEKSPAQESGLQIGDIIQKIDQKLVNTASDVQDQVESKPVGTLLSIEILRQNKPKMLEVRTASLTP